MYSSHIAQELARAKTHDQLASAEAYRLAAAARRARPRRPGWAGIPAAVRGLVPRLRARRLAAGPVSASSHDHSLASETGQFNP